MSNEEKVRLKNKEAELLLRIDRLQITMRETNELKTIAFKAKLYKEAREELRRIQEKLAGLS